MKRRTFEYFEYEPGNYRVDGRGVVASLVILLVFLMTMIAVH